MAWLFRANRPLGTSSAKCGWQDRSPLRAHASFGSFPLRYSSAATRNQSAVSSARPSDPVPRHVVLSPDSPRTSQEARPRSQSRHPFRTVQRFEYSRLSEQTLDGTDGGLAVAVAFQVAERSSLIGQAWNAPLHRLSHRQPERFEPGRVAFEEPLQDVLQEAGIVRIRQQSKRAGFKGVRAAQENESPLVVQAGHRDGQRLEADSPLRPIKRDAPAPRRKRQRLSGSAGQEEEGGHRTPADSLNPRPQPRQGQEVRRGIEGGLKRMGGAQGGDVDDGVVIEYAA